MDAIISSNAHGSGMCTALPNWNTRKFSPMIVRTHGNTQTEKRKLSPFARYTEFRYALVDGWMDAAGNVLIDLMQIIF